MKRFSLAVLFCALASASIVSGASAALTIRTYPFAPCDSNTVSLVFGATGCEVITHAYLRETGGVYVRRVLDQSGPVCDPAAPIHDRPVLLGEFAAGHFSIVIEDVLVRITIDSTASGPIVRTDSTTTLRTFNFDVGFDCPPAGPIIGLPYVNGWSMRPDRLCAAEPLYIQLFGTIPTSVVLQEVAVIDPTHVSLLFHSTDRATGTRPWSQLLPVGMLPAGIHLMNVEVISNDGFGGVRTANYGVGDFEVETCSIPAPGDSIPYVSTIRVLPADHREGPICPDDSIRVVFEGWFPSTCYIVRSLRLIPSPVMTPLPMPPIVELVIDDQRCLDILCNERRPVPWTASITMPPLPPREYQLIVQGGVTTCSDSVPPESLYTMFVPFQVAPYDSCQFRPPCFIASWNHWEQSRGCDAFIRPGRPAEVHFQVQTQVPLAGLQGCFDVLGNLRITNIESEGAAEGMRVTWTPTSNGARWVLFGKDGSVIPAGRVSFNVLKVTLEAVGDSTPGITHVIHRELVASDALGNQVPHCPIMTLVVEWATICPDRVCDANQDGGADVRDLILMLRCLHGEGACPDSSVFDCSADGLLNLDDVLCCAQHVLIDGCRDCPVDSVRDEPGVAVRFDAPASVQGGIEVPIVISGIDYLGATTLRIAYPDRRFTVTDVSVGSSSWMALHETRAEGLVIGLLKTGPLSGPLEMVVRVRLALASGQSSGGELRVIGSQFNGSDGVRLNVPGAAPYLRLGATTVELSAPRPNPASGLTRLTLALDAEAPVDVAVHDVAGRRVATLARGRMPAGEHVLTWDGRADGRRLGEGVYFVRAAVDGRVQSRRIVLLGSR